MFGKNPIRKQEIAFNHIRDTLHNEIIQDEGLNGIAQRIHQDGTLDDCMLGNLIYMVEIGRYDTRSLFRWVAKYASEHPDLLQKIKEEDQLALTAMPLSKAFVLETLRMDQSELLVRHVQRDIVFDGLLIPRYSTVRLCLWESHNCDLGISG